VGLGGRLVSRRAEPLLPEARARAVAALEHVRRTRVPGLAG
jgi:hypothetical protein